VLLHQILKYVFDRNFTRSNSVHGYHGNMLLPSQMDTFLKLEKVKKEMLNHKNLKKNLSRNGYSLLEIKTIFF